MDLNTSKPSKLRSRRFMFSAVFTEAHAFENGDNRFINAAKLNDDPTGEPTGIIRVDDP